MFVREIHNSRNYEPKKKQVVFDSWWASSIKSEQKAGFIHLCLKGSGMSSIVCPTPETVYSTWKIEMKGSHFDSFMVSPSIVINGKGLD